MRLAPWLLALVLSAGCGLFHYDVLPDEDTRLPDRTAIAGVDVSRLTIREARTRLPQTPPAYRFRLPDRTVELEAGAIGIGYDLDAALLGAVNGEPAEALLPEVNTGALHKAMEAFAKQYSAGAVDAAATFTGGSSEPFSFTDARPGIEIDADALFQAVLRAVQAQQTEIAVPHSVLQPAVTAADLRAQNQCLGRFTTSFAKSPQNAADRVFNIRKAAAAIDGVILAPDAAFDCNAVLGDRNEENGWRMAAGIRGGQYVQEYGGGVCQVSSTLFNAVMMADLPITERHPHSWPMSYVDIGRDATISTGGKNFCFVNSTGAPLTLSASVDGDGQTVTVALYGTPVLPDGQYITVSSERTGTLPALPDELLLDESLPYGTRVVEREGREGRTARTYKEYHAADGTLLRRELAYEDTYRSISARVYVSTDLYAAKTAAAED